MIICPHCGKQHGERPEFVGKQVKCGKCKKSFIAAMHGGTPSAKSRSMAKRIPSQPAVVTQHEMATRPAPVPAVAPASELIERVPCKFCGEFIISTAVKCKHCNEFLDGRPKEQPIPLAAAFPAAQPNISVNVQQQTTVVNQRKRWSALVAMFLSFLIPGLGQIYKGQALNGIVWFVVVVIGYVVLIIPGIVLHICCILGAGLGDAYR